MANKSRFNPRNLKSGWPVWVAAAAALVFGLVLLICRASRRTSS